MDPAEVLERNRAFWDGYSDAYQARHAEHIGRAELRWGVWQLPESDLAILGDVRGKDVLELGCGAGQWSIVLARQGARPVGIDISNRQLDHARRLSAEAGVEFPLLRASAHDVPLPDESFDLVVSDWGATSFLDPALVVPEAARLLRRGGMLAFSGGTPLGWICAHPETGIREDRLHHSYFGLTGGETGVGSIEFQLTYGEWIRLFRRSGFLVEDLVELRPPERATSTYRNATELAWARRWPQEHVWKVRKR
jgi:SAM-dependent methyltransferase